jgi:Geranylgeranyl pyrophosphate synthase
MNIDKLLNTYSEITERRLNELCNFDLEKNKYKNVLIDSMRYSLINGGKRLRPYLTLEFAKICGNNYETALDSACAVEMIHAYSLIHDDLPCMDDDDLRRGKPSNHKVFGEAVALLAGDALQTLAFETIINCNLPFEYRIKAVKALAFYSGVHGMAGGQAIDLLSENELISGEDLTEMHSLKTSALITCACKLGCIAAGADEKKIKASELFGQNLGLLFQITDDILDVTSDFKTLGKTVGKDEKQNKNTFVTKYGLEKAKELCEFYLSKAKASLTLFNEDTSNIMLLCDLIKSRKK